MATVLTAPENPETMFISFPIEKWERDDSGDLIVKGVATDGSVDSDLQVVDSSWSGPALAKWLETGGNVRMAHDPRKPVGKGLQIEIDRDGDGKHRVQSLIVDPLAQKMIEKGVLTAYSLGISHPVIKRDPTGQAPGGIICGGELSELSIVDRPSCKNAYLELAKAAANGSCEFTGKVYGADDLLTKEAHEEDVTVTVPKTAQITFSPADLAKLLDHRAQAETRQQDAALKAIMAAEAGTYKRDIDTATRRRLAGQGRALSNLSYPIETHEDADNAVTLALSGHGNVSEAKALIRRVASKEGWQDILDRLDGKGSDSADKAAAPPKGKKCRTCKGSGKIRDGNMTCPDCKGKGRMMPGSGDDDSADKASGVTAAEPQAVKSDSGEDDPELHHQDGEDDDTDSDADAMDKSALAALGARMGWSQAQMDALPAEAVKVLLAADVAAAQKAAAPDMTKPPKVPCGSCGRKCKPSAKFCPGCGKGMSAEKADRPTPGEGVTGAAEHDVEPAPEHREPDGPAIESLEHDAHLPTVPDSEALASKTAEMHARLGVPWDTGWVHDLTCPAFHPQVAKAAHPLAHLGMLDETEWQSKALDAAAASPFDEDRARSAALLWQHARTVKAVPADLADELRLEAHKAFRDANPGPGSAPTPGEIVASRFNRPYLSAGHGAPSPEHKGPNTSPVHPGHISAADFQRDLITAGHAADGPENATPRHMPVQAPEVPGVPSRVYYTHMMRDNARQAMSAMHDHISRTFPDICPMHQPPSPGEVPSRARPVPAGVGGPVPHRGGATKADEGAQAAPQGDGNALAQVTRLERKLLRARKAAGLEPEAAGEPAVLTKAATVDPDLIKAAAAEAFSPLVAELRGELAAARGQIEAQAKTLKKQGKVLDAIAGQPDPAVTAYRGVALAGTPKTPAAAQPTVAQYAERARATALNAHYDTWNNDPDPEARLRALDLLMKMAGLDGQQKTP